MPHIARPRTTLPECHIPPVERRSRSGRLRSRDMAHGLNLCVVSLARAPQVGSALAVCVLSGCRSKDLPLLRYAFELVRAAVFEYEAGTGGEVAHGAAHQYLACAGLWVPKTCPGMLSRRFARGDRVRRDAARPLSSLEPRRSSSPLKPRIVRNGSSPGPPVRRRERRRARQQTRRFG